VGAGSAREEAPESTKKQKAACAAFRSNIHHLNTW
jgi:hypothetical protein